MRHDKTIERNQQELQEMGGTDFGFAYGDAARFRVSVFRQRGDLALVLRLIPNEFLTFDQIGLPPICKDLIRRPRGLFVVTGPTGSGKTTCARLLTRLADPTEGVVRVGGVDLREVDPDARRAAIRMVPQDGFLFDVSIRDNIAYGREGTTAAEVERAIDVLGLRGWIETLPDGLDTVVGERGGATG